MPLKSNWQNGDTFNASDANDIATAVNSAEQTANKAQANGYASLDSNGRIPVTQLPNSVMEYQGTWNASTNSPSLSDGTGSAGDVYRVSVAATRNLGSGNITFDVGDYVIYSGSVWQKADTTDAVSSVAGRTGDVVLTKSDVGLGNVDNTADANKDVLSASKLTTARTINGVSFDGTANITVPSGIQRSVQTITTSITIGAAANTDYFVFANMVHGDPSYSSVVANLHFNGADNSTTFTDSSPSPVTWTRSGDAKISTTQSKFGGASAFFDGTGDFLSAPASSSRWVFTGDHTIESWIFPTTTSVGLIFGTGGAGSSDQFLVSAGTGNAEIYWGFAAIGGPLTTTATIPTNTWTHVAVSRSGTSLKAFVNGTQVASATASGTIGANSTAYIGMRQGTSIPFTGYLDDLRVTTVARYTSNFTVPGAQYPDASGSVASVTLPTAVSNTNLYTVKPVGGGPIDVNLTSGQTIDGTSSPYTLPGSSILRVLSDGSNWRTV